MKIRANITVFAALSLMLTASFLFALLEAARVRGLETCAVLVSRIGLESVCAEYQPELWKQYHLLYLDGAYGTEHFSMGNVTERMEQRVTENLAKPDDGSNLLQLQFVQAQPQEYTLAADGDGAAFLKQAALYMKKSLPERVMKELYDNYQEGRQVEESEGAEYSVEDADRALREAKEAEQSTEQEALPDEVPVEESGGGQDVVAQETEGEVENPLELVLALKENAILGMVVEDISGLSSNQVSLKESVSKRQRQKGTGTESETVRLDWKDRVLILEYLDECFCDYTEPKAAGALSYELEYVLCGKDSDRENLEGAVNRLLFLREVANVTHILSNSQKLNEALTIATALAGFSGNPAVIKIVQIGIVAAWAYVESILDVRTLLAGGKIALLKNRQQWTADTGNLAGALQNHARAKECDNGFSYQTYLKLFLFGMKTGKLAYRMMDVMEWAIRKVPEYANFRMDFMIGSLSYAYSYETRPLFSGLASIGSGKPAGYVFETEKQFSYME